MLNSGWRTTALGLSVGLALVLAGCEGPPASESAPPPGPMAESAPPPAPDLAGGPPASTPAPPPGDVTQTARMDPIPNPEDMSPEQREAVYGHRYDHGRIVSASSAPHHAPGRRVHGVILASGMVAGLRHAAPAKPRPAVAAPAAKPPAPVVAAAPIPAKQADRLLQLQTALKGPFAQAAALTVSDDLMAGKSGQVTLSLPAAALDQIGEAAGKLDLTDSAKVIDLGATLTGAGYAITPTGEQTAHVVAGQPLSFTWQVAPMAGAAPGDLNVAVAAELKGSGAVKDVPLLSMNKSVKPPATEEAAAAQKEGSGALASLDNKLGDVRLPGVGSVAVGFLVAIVVLILAGLALVWAARQSQERERERRRRARAAAAARFDEQVEQVRETAPAGAPPEPVKPHETV